MTQAQALIFGINEVDPAGYDGKWDGKLSFCEKDATLVADLTKARGFATTLLLTKEVTKQRMIDETLKAANALAEGDIFLFYFSGHGNTTADECVAGVQSSAVRNDCSVFIERPVTRTVVPAHGQGVMAAIHQSGRVVCG